MAQALHLSYAQAGPAEVWLLNTIITEGTELMWKHGYSFACAIACVSLTTLASVAAQSGPSTLPRVQFSDLTFVGGFRLPSTSSDGHSFSFGGRQLAFNPYSNSLFIGSRSGRVAEVSIPAAVHSSNPSDMPVATYLQPFADPTEGNLTQIPGDVTLDGLLVYGNRLYGTASVFYDALNRQRVSHYSRSLQLNAPSFKGWSSVWDATKTGYVSGWMSVVPAEWRGLLGGPAVTGQCCIPIVTRTSFGPSAFAFDPAQIGTSQATVPASPLLYYTENIRRWACGKERIPRLRRHDWHGRPGDDCRHAHRALLWPHRPGAEFCYGTGTADASKHGTIGLNNEQFCYDPTSTDKGQHAYPYRYQIWAYDLNDFAAVKAGTKQPWEIVPYGVWPLELPTPEPTATKLGGVGYDAATQTLYVSQLYADKGGLSYRPIIHVIRVNANPGSNDTPEPPDDEQPDPVTPTSGYSGVVSATTMSVNRTSPQVKGTPITFRAFATGGIQPPQSKWLVDAGGGFQPVTGWSAIDSFT